MSTLTTLQLANFRNYQSLNLNFNNGLVIIHGNNGAGKTNLLEAISLLAPGRGLRGARLDEIICSRHCEEATPTRQSRAIDSSPGLPRFARNDESIGTWSVIGEVSNYKITTGFEPGSAKRIIKIDDEKQRGANILSQYASIIWLTPQMDGVFLEGNSERRMFFDRIIYNFDPEHASRVAVYENAMRERMRLLKTASSDKIWLKVLERRMAEYGTAIAAARNEVISYLQESLDHSATSFPRPHIDIRGQFEKLLHENSALEAEDIFAHQLEESRYDDYSNGRTAIGVHKTDFHVINTAKNMPAALSSTGEQKALLLSIIIGLARLLKTRKSKTPIVLLDEVIAHLDEHRRAELFSELLSLNCQTFLTGTETALFGDIPGQFIEVKSALVMELTK